MQINKFLYSKTNLVGCDLTIGSKPCQLAGGISQANKLILKLALITNCII